MVLESVKFVIQVKILLIVYYCMWDLAEISENLNSLYIFSSEKGLVPKFFDYKNLPLCCSLFQSEQSLEIHTVVHVLYRILCSSFRVSECFKSWNSSKLCKSSCKY